MTEASLADHKFYNCCFILSKEDILKLDEADNGPINNVIIGIARHCYGVRLYDDQHGLAVDMFYINGVKQLKGDIINLKLTDDDYYEMLLRFCAMLSDDYRDVNFVDAFNTFQQRLRGFLEKRGFFTTTSQELKPFQGKGGVMISWAHRGIFKLDVIDKTAFYRDFFSNTPAQEIEKGKDYVYIMINTDTSLVKIGKSNNPRYRERTLHSQEPSIHLIALWCCSGEIEKKLHAKFSDKRVRGEWFRLSFKDLTELEKFMNIEVPPILH
jgi:hypothetical protein